MFQFATLLWNKQSGLRHLNNDNVRSRGNGYIPKFFLFLFFFNVFFIFSRSLMNLDVNKGNDRSNGFFFKYII